MTSQFEHLFAATVLDVVVPNTSLEFPPSQLATDEWLDSLRSGTLGDRREAFFDEHIQAVLTARIPHPEPENSPVDPPHTLLSFLAHFQVSLEASYISPTPDITDHPNTATPRTDVPPRSVSLKGKKPMALNLSPNPSPKVPPQSVHPPILPPATPIPTPASAETDRRYAQSEGVMLCTRIWGAEGPSTLGDEGDEATENPDSKQETVEMTRNQAKPQEDFHLIWSERENVWVAAYKIVFTVAYLRLPFRLPAGVSPLLCITLSTTLRDLPVAVNGPKNPLARYISTIGGNRLTVPSSSPIVPSAPNLSSQPEVSAPKGGLGEVNLLGALFSVPSALQSPVSPSSTPVINPPESQLVLPSTRLGSSMRSSLFFLPSTPAGLPPSPLYSPMQTPGGGLKPASHPTLRKSFRKTLFATSGFKVRMRTVFVPSLTIDAEQDEGYLSGDGVERNDGKNRSEEGDKEEQDEPSSGSEEGTVVLCVEIENEQDHFSKSSDYGGRNAGGFLVERVEVSIGGGESEGASAHLIGWGADALLSLKRKKATVDNNFPLLLTPREQFNLLYAVTFLRSPEEVDYMSTLSIEGRSAGLKLGNKALAQAAGGKDMLQRSVTLKIFGRPSYVSPSETETSFYPTSTFCTRWNCILDLSTTSLIDRRAEDDSMESTPTANPNRPFSTSAPSVLPEPASPFPASITSPRLPPSNVGPLIAGDARRASFGTLSKSGTSSRSSTPAYASSIADSRRHTVAGAGITSGAAGLIKAATAGARNSFAPGMSSPPLPERRDGFPGVPPQRERRDSGPRSSPLSYTPPSTVLQTQIPRSPTTYEAPPLPPFKDRAGNLTVSVPGPSLDQVMMGHMPPVTPAYPAYPTHASPNQSPLPPTPNLGPYIPQGGANVSPGYGSYSGPSVEVPRDKGLMMGSSPGYSPQTPTPHVGFGNGGAPPGIFDGGGGVGLNMSRLGGGVADPIVVSIGLIHKGKSTETGKIHPSDRFALNIFVFNKSSWTRRFDVSCPDPRMLRKNEERLGSLRKSFESGRATALPGVVPLENRVRIGPLHPSACQSVGIEFLALAPGVHSIDTLTLTDVETGFSMNLRSVMDIVVHENYDDMS